MSIKEISISDEDIRVILKVLEKDKKTWFGILPSTYEVVIKDLNTVQKSQIRIGNEIIDFFIESGRVKYNVTVLPKHPGTLLLTEEDRKYLKEKRQEAKERWSNYPTTILRIIEHKTGGKTLDTSSTTFSIPRNYIGSSRDRAIQAFNDSETNLKDENIMKVSNGFIKTISEKA